MPTPGRNRYEKDWSHSSLRLLNSPYRTDIEDYIIVHDSERVGRLQINNDVQSIRVINLSLLPAYRNKGIGADILKGIIREADSTGREVLFEVDKVNPAATLYRRLGFEACKEDALKYVMRYAPSPGRSGEGDIPNV